MMGRAKTFPPILCSTLYALSHKGDLALGALQNGGQFGLDFRRFQSLEDKRRDRPQAAQGSLPVSWSKWTLKTNEVHGQASRFSLVQQIGLTTYGCSPL